MVDKSIYSKEYQIFIALLRQARIDAGVTQELLAERLGATQTFVSKCERGERRLDIVELREFCLAINLSMSTFVEAFENKLR